MWPVGHRLDLPACQSRFFLLRASINHHRIKCRNLNFQRGNGLIYKFLIQDVMMHHYTHNWFDIEFYNTKHLASLPWWPMRTIPEAGTNYPLEKQQLSLWSISMSSPFTQKNIHVTEKKRQGHYGKWGSDGKPTVLHLSFWCPMNLSFTKQLFLLTLLIAYTRAIPMPDLWMHLWKCEGSLFVLFLCNLESKPFSEFLVFEIKCRETY